MKILFMGEGKDAADVLSWTCRRKDIFVKAVVGDESVEKVANISDIPFFDLDRFSDNKAIGQTDYDLIVLFLYGKILKEPLVSSARYGCINFHPAPLPDYKGRAGCSFAILDKVEEWGCSAHYVDTGIDTGRIIEVRKFPIKWSMETGASLKEKTVCILKKMYKDILERVIREGILPSSVQERNDGKYISKRTMLDAMEIRPGDDINAKIQAFWFPPHEGAYIVMENKKYMLINDVIMSQIMLDSGKS